MSNYYPPPPGIGGGQRSSLPPPPQLDFRPPPNGPSGSGGRGGGRGGRNRHGRNRDHGDRSSNANSSLPARPPPAHQFGAGGSGGGDSHVPRGDFTFRADKPAGVHEAQLMGGDRYIPRDSSRRDHSGRDFRDRDRDGDRRGAHNGPRSQQYGGGGRRGGGRESHNANSRRHGGRGGGYNTNFADLRFLAANRPILNQSDISTGGIVQDFVKDSNAGTTYLNLDELSDSDEAEMDISGDEDGMSAPPRKRARLGAKDGDEVPKWSNPDPYTVLPPTEAGVRKKDVVQLIRKARVQGEKAAAATSGDTEEFISCGFDSSSEEEGEAAEESAADENNGDADTNIIGVDRIGRNGKMTKAGERDASAAAAASSATNDSQTNNIAPPVDAPKGPRAATKQNKNGITSASSSVPTPSSLSTELRTNRKRTHDDQLKPLLLPDHAILKKTTKMPVGGYILPMWQVKAGETACPWLLEDHAADTSHMGVWLHKEIFDFYAYIRPRTFEQTLRQALLDDLDAMVRKRFPNGRIHCFGSFMSGLYLPTGDMDIVMCSTQFLNNRAAVFSKKNHLFKFGAFLCGSNMAEREHLEHITKAKVPLVKYIDLKTGLKVDVSFENMNGVVANKTFLKWKEQFPEMPILVTMIKQFLTMRGLNEPVNGGIGGFSVICLVVSMLQLMPPMQTKDMVGQNHLGDLLMHFFDLYGNKFNYEATAISMNPPGYVAKSKVRHFVYKNPDRLSIIDPNNPENDISGGSKNTSAIMRAFSDAFDSLQKRMMDLAKLPADARAGQSILSVVLEGDYSTYRAQREYLRELYTRQYNHEPSD
ncbi:DNA polymerase sigma subunit [Sporothrix schenckii 1099-18]|uniref:polynucleotide adenylyltransferase n=1 Tax=Sporothrix schenckii 1099-18 TaxID=1397361 RepID=A0A0F2MDB9_SPOSC|nr:DNA polymerase sigma subunit [Sporothrix schenckii 1099-18]KJR87688.1 DNA polymerase sigma subunit [Sporothrix schenckii 1099-18]